jgi:hypothetical protein
MPRRIIVSILIGLTLILSTFISTVSIVQKIAYAQARTEPSGNGVSVSSSMTQASTVVGRNSAVQGVAVALHYPTVLTSAQHPIVTIGSGIRYIAGQTNRIIPGGALSSIRMTSVQHSIVGTIGEKIVRMSTVPNVQKIAYAQARTEPSGIGVNVANSMTRAVVGSNGVHVANSMTHALTVIGSNAEPSRSTVIQGLAGALSAVHMTSAQRQHLAQALLLLLGLFVRPTLIVIGLIAGIIFSYVALKILIYGFSGLPHLLLN